MTLGLMAGACFAESNDTAARSLPESRDPCLAFIADADYASQTLLMQLEDREIDLRIPIQFFEDFWDQRDGFTDTAQLFRVEIGTFLPVSRAETGRRSEQGIWNWMTFVIGDQLPLEDLAVLSAESRSRVNGGNLDRRVNDYEALSGPFGLSEIRSEAPQPTLPFRTNTYTHWLGDEDLSAVISCNASDSVAYPICIHWFRAAGMDVELSYRRVELSNWRTLQDDVTAFLTCAISAPL